VKPTPLENLRRLLDGGTPHWIPFSLDVGACPGFTSPVQRVFQQATGGDQPATHFDADVRVVSLAARFGGNDPVALHAAVEPGTTFDEWGIGHYAGGAEGAVEKSYAPLARARSPRDVEALPSPVIEMGTCAAEVAACHAAGYPVFGYAGSIYEWSWWLRGMEQFLVDLVTDPPLAEAIVRKVEAYTLRLAEATASAGVDVLCFYDDAGMQRGMQLAPALWRRYVRPSWQRVLDSLRSRFPHARFFLHSCGKIDPIVPDVVDLGFHILHPIQPECMDFAATYREYGDRIVAAGTISAQRVLPFGTPDDVRREVQRLAEIAGARRRTILMPSNRIQPETPWENVVAFAEACRLVKVRSAGEPRPLAPSTGN